MFLLKQVLLEGTGILRGAGHYIVNGSRIGEGIKINLTDGVNTVVATTDKFGQFEVQNVPCGGKVYKIPENFIIIPGGDVYKYNYVVQSYQFNKEPLNFTCDQTDKDKKFVIFNVSMKYENVDFQLLDARFILRYTKDKRNPLHHTQIYETSGHYHQSKTADAGTCTNGSFRFANLHEAYQVSSSAFGMRYQDDIYTMHFDRLGYINASFAQSQSQIASQAQNYEIGPYKKDSIYDAKFYGVVDWTPYGLRKSPTGRQLSPFNTAPTVIDVSPISLNRIQITFNDNLVLKTGGNLKAAFKLLRKNKEPLVPTQAFAVLNYVELTFDVNVQDVTKVVDEQKNPILSIVYKSNIISGTTNPDLVKFFNLPALYYAPFDDNQEELLRLTNIERARFGLNPLKADIFIMRMARIKCLDMVFGNYLEHVSPRFGNPSDMSQKRFLSSIGLGENINAGYCDPVSAIRVSWMNSPGHRANILMPEYSHFGGFLDMINYNDKEAKMQCMGVQMFSNCAPSKCKGDDHQFYSSFDSYHDGTNRVPVDNFWPNNIKLSQDKKQVELLFDFQLEEKDLTCLDQQAQNRNFYFVNNLWYDDRENEGQWKNNLTWYFKKIESKGNKIIATVEDGKTLPDVGIVNYTAYGPGWLLYPQKNAYPKIVYPPDEPPPCFVVRDKSLTNYLIPFTIDVNSLDDRDSAAKIGQLNRHYLEQEKQNSFSMIYDEVNKAKVGAKFEINKSLDALLQQHVRYIVKHRSVVLEKDMKELFGTDVAVFCLYDQMRLNRAVSRYADEMTRIKNVLGGSKYFLATQVIYAEQRHFVALLSNTSFKTSPPPPADAIYVPPNHTPLPFVFACEVGDSMEQCVCTLGFIRLEDDQFVCASSCAQPDYVDLKNLGPVRENKCFKASDVEGATRRKIDGTWHFALNECPTAGTIPRLCFYQEGLKNFTCPAGGIFKDNVCGCASGVVLPQENLTKCSCKFDYTGLNKKAQIVCLAAPGTYKLVAVTDVTSIQQGECLNTTALSVDYVSGFDEEQKLLFGQQCNVVASLVKSCIYNFDKENVSTQICGKHMIFTDKGQCRCGLPPQQLQVLVEHPCIYVQDGQKTCSAGSFLISNQFSQTCVSAICKDDNTDKIHCVYKDVNGVKQVCQGFYSFGLCSMQNCNNALPKTDCFFQIKPSKDDKEKLYYCAPSFTANFGPNKFFCGSTNIYDTHAYIIPQMPMYECIDGKVQCRSNYEEINKTCVVKEKSTLKMTVENLEVTVPPLSSSRSSKSGTIVVDFYTKSGASRYRIEQNVSSVETKNSLIINRDDSSVVEKSSVSAKQISKLSAKEELFRGLIDGTIEDTLAINGRDENGLYLVPDQTRPKVDVISKPDVDRPPPVEDNETDNGTDVPSEPPKENKGLSGGGIAAIVIVLLLVIVGVVIGVGFWFFKKQGDHAPQWFLKLFKSKPKVDDGAIDLRQVNHQGTGVVATTQIVG